jgi:Tripartite tricarboxylate transporter family receptor
MKNRKREICTSGSVRDEDGQPPHLLGRRNFLHLAASAAALPAVLRVARAQAYPTRPVRLIVGFPAGGGADTLARLTAQWLSERLGQTFIVENRPGAGSNIATEAVVRALPEGYTLLVATSANAFNATLYDKLNFNFIRDGQPTLNPSKMDPLRTCAVFVPALGSRKDHRTATLRVCFHALQLTKRIERANRNQFEAHEVGLSQR